MVRPLHPRQHMLTWGHSDVQVLASSPCCQELTSPSYWALCSLLPPPDTCWMEWAGQLSQEAILGRTLCPGLDLEGGRWHALLGSFLEGQHASRLQAKPGPPSPSRSAPDWPGNLAWRCSQPDLCSVFLAGTSLVQHLMTVLIRRHSQLFSGKAPEGPAAPHGGPPCTVGWGSEEVLGDSQAEPSGLHPPSLRISSMDGAAVATLSRNSPRGRGVCLVTHGPGKRLQTPSSWKPSFGQSGSRSGSSSPEVPTASSSRNWLVNGLSSLRGHRRSSSGDQLKDSASQRLSTYDNVPVPSPGPSAPSVSSLAWSGASSCEASLGGSISSCSAYSSLHPEGTPEPSPVPSSIEELRSPDPGHSLEEAAVCLSSSEPIEPSSLARDPAPHSKVLQGLVAELRAELCRQRTEHELSVRR